MSDMHRMQATLSADAEQCDPHETNFILTEAPNAPSALQRYADEIVFEEFEFASYYRGIGRCYILLYIQLAC